MLVALKRWTFDILFMIAFTAFSVVGILGENTLWHLDFVDTLYSALGTNEYSMFIFVWVTGFVLDVFVMILWNAGILGWLMDWIDNI